jgi:hypothetical protein
VDVVGQEAVTQNPESESRAALREAIEVDLAIPIIAENRLAFIASGDHMVDPTRKVDPHGPRQD